MASNSNKKIHKLQVTSWEKGRLVKKNMYFNDAASAIEAGKYYEGKIKVYNDKGEVCHAEDEEDRKKKKEHEHHHEHDDETYA